MTKFKKMRLRLKLSQEKLARELGVSTASVVNFEREPTQEIMDKMDKLLKKKAKK